MNATNGIMINNDLKFFTISPALPELIILVMKRAGVLSPAYLFLTIIGRSSSAFHLDELL
jgi:hypothetical protein